MGFGLREDTNREKILCVPLEARSPKPKALNQKMSLSENVVRIAVDAMGGDYAPSEVVRGAADFVRASPNGEMILLLGDPDAIHQELAASGASPEARLVVVPAPQIVTFHDHPMEAFRQKPDSSLVRAVTMVKEGAADAAFSAGNTGAFMVAATMTLDKIEGVQRPGIATLLPNETGGYVVITDAGANVDCRASHLFHFGLMGSVFAERALGIESPRVGVLSNGEEEEKGDSLSLGAYKMLAAAGDRINFIGNVEGNHVFEGRVDVAVCDGFVGNVLLKGAEGVVRMSLALLKAEREKAIDDAARETLTNAFRALEQRMDYSEMGGAPLLGVNGVVIIAHGRSERRAIANGIKQASRAVRSQLVTGLRDALQAAASGATA